MVFSNCVPNQQAERYLLPGTESAVDQGHAQPIRHNELHEGLGRDSREGVVVNCEHQTPDCQIVNRRTVRAIFICANHSRCSEQE